MSVVTDSKCQAELSFKCWGIISDFRAGKWWAGSSVLGRCIWCLYMLWGGRKASRGTRQQTRCVRKSLDWGGCRWRNKRANLRDFFFFKHRIKFEFRSMEETEMSWSLLLQKWESHQGKCVGERRWWTHGVLGSLHIASFRRVTSAGGVGGAGKVAFTS